MIVMLATFFLIFRLRILVQGKLYEAHLQTSSHCALKPVQISIKFTTLVHSDSIHVGYWPSVRSRWLNIDQDCFYLVCWSAPVPIITNLFVWFKNVYQVDCGMCQWVSRFVTWVNISRNIAWVVMVFWKELYWRFGSCNFASTLLGVFDSVSSWIPIKIFFWLKLTISY